MKYFIFFLGLGLVLSGCQDDNNLNERNRYIFGAEVRQLPNLQYDSDNSPPDLRVDIKRRSANFWEFSSLVRNNANRLPTFLQFPSEILATDEWYEISLVDEDAGELSDDEIFFWEFHPVEEGGAGIYEFFDSQNRLVMILEYDVQSVATRSALRYSSCLHSYNLCL